MRERIENYIDRQRLGALSGRPKFTDIYFDKIDLSEMNLLNVDFIRCKFRDCSFDGAIVLGATFKYCSGLNSCTFDDVDHLDIFDNGSHGMYPLIKLDKFLSNYEEMCKVSDSSKRLMYENQTREEELFRNTFFSMYGRFRPSLKANLSTGDLPTFFKTSFGENNKKIKTENPYKHRPILSSIEEEDERSESPDENEITDNIFKMDM